MVTPAVRAALAGMDRAHVPLDPRLRFQWENIIPPIVNIGCESDPGRFGYSPAIRCVNVDIDLWRAPRFVCAALQHYGDFAYINPLP